MYAKTMNDSGKSAKVSKAENRKNRKNARRGYQELTRNELLKNYRIFPWKER